MDELITTQQNLLKPLRDAAGLTPEVLDEMIMPVIERYPAYVHLLPAGETHHPRKSSWTVVRVRPAWCSARHNEAE